MIGTPDIVIRLLAAVAFCGAVGLQRALVGKAAGMRTHILVGVGAALFTLLSGYAFRTSPTNTDRIAAQIVSGIGFIGGGAILKERGSIKGLTTAAGLWAAAALGMAAGAGLYVMGIAATAIILLTLIALRYVEMRFPRRALETWRIAMTLDDEAGFGHMRRVLEPHCRKVGLESLTWNPPRSMTVAIEIRHHFDIAAVSEELRAAGARTVAWSVAGDADMEEGP